jgi:hypothetical protein
MGLVWLTHAKPDLGKMTQRPMKTNLHLHFVLLFFPQELFTLTMQEPPCFPRASSQASLKISWKMFMVNESTPTLILVNCVQMTKQHLIM